MSTRFIVKAIMPDLGARYLNTALGFHSWNDDPHTATKFKRRVDAAAIMRTKLGRDWILTVERVTQ